jgi:hypothetical protein
MPRRESHSRMVSARAGCDGCSSSWNGNNALAVAAKHHDKTRHRTWAEVTQRTEYGSAPGAPARREARLL